MADEFETKPEAEQDKREQAKRDLADLQKLMAEVQGSSVDSGEQPEPKKQETVSVDELIDRAASDAESDTEPEETEQAEQKIDAPSQIDESQSKDAETQKQETKLEPKKEETLEERQQEEREQAQREAVLNQQKRRREAAQAAAGTPVEQKEQSRKKTKKKEPHKTHKDARLARKRHRQLVRMGTVLVVALVALVLIVSAVRGIAGGSSKKDNTKSKKATTSAVTNDQKDTNTPASQQETKQYLKIKDDTSLPAYAKEYPGLYATAATTQKKLSDKKVCYLTFDDGPSDTCTPKILDTLKKYNVKATFFVVTSEIDGNEKLIQRIIDEGHTLCIHANEHEYQKIYASPEAYLKDFAAAYDKIYALTGYKVQGFRFPGGSNGQLKHYGNYDAIIKEMNRRGFEYYDWNAYDHDAEGGNYSAAELAQYAVHEVSISSRNDVIVLMHDTYGKENTVKALPSIIEGIQKQGIECLPITKTTRPVHFSVNENTPAEYTEETKDSDKSSSSKSETKN